MGYARSRSLTVTADGANNQTGPCSCKYGGIATIEAPGVMTGTINLQRRGRDMVWVDVTDNTGTLTTFTKIGTYTIAPQSTQAEYRLNCKSGGFVAGPFTMMIEGR